VRTWIGRGDAGAVAVVASQWLRSQHEPFDRDGARCASMHDGDTWAVVLVPRYAEIDAAPVTDVDSAVVHFGIQLPSGATGPTLMVVAPDGRAAPAPTFDVHFDRDGIYALQWIATTDRGPLPFATWHARVGDARLARSAEHPAENTFQVFAGINRARAAVGAAPLRRDPLLDAIAAERARTLAARGAIEHGTGSGDSPVSRMVRNRVGADRVAENVARGHSTADANARLAASPSHLANRLDPTLDAVGFGIATLGDDVYLVELYATRPRIDGTSTEDTDPDDR
jgi:uncharacterized protein YkwD